MTPEEAYQVFHLLRGKQSTVFCIGRLWGWTLSIVGTIVSANRDEIIIVSADRRSASLSLRLDAEDLLIRHAEPREIPMVQPPNEFDSDLASLAISLPLRIRPADLKHRLLEAPPRELLFILELPSGTDSE